MNAFVGSERGLAIHPAIAAAILGGIFTIGVVFYGSLSTKIDHHTQDISSLAQDMSGLKASTANLAEEERARAGSIAAIEQTQTSILIAIQALKENSDEVKTKIQDLQKSFDNVNDIIRPPRPPSR